MDNLPGVLKTPPPWDANTGKLQLRLRAIGLPALTAEGQVVHIHQHLDLFVDGKPVDGRRRHRHRPRRRRSSRRCTPTGRDGVLHVESPTQERFSLGQFFARLGRAAGRQVPRRRVRRGQQGAAAWVNGVAVQGDPTRIVLAEKQEIVIAYGTAAADARPRAVELRLPGGALAGHDGPGHDAVPRDDAVGDIRVVGDERLDLAQGRRRGRRTSRRSAAGRAPRR